MVDFSKLVDELSSLTVFEAAELTKRLQEKWKSSNARPLINLTTIKSDLPHWPDDVVEQWLLKLANRGADTDWPPPEPLDGHAWQYILGARPLSWWKNVSWRLEEHDLEFEVLSGATKRTINAMLDGFVNEVPNIYMHGPQQKARLQSVLTYVTKHGSVPEPVIVMRLKDGLSVLDGNHRVAALCLCQIAFEDVVKGGGTAPLKSHQLWMGTHSDGEVPGL